MGRREYYFYILNMYEGFSLCTSHIFFLLGKYYIVDAGYLLRSGYLPSYKGQRYRLSHFCRAGRGNHLKERFNYVHLSLRRVIERTFGVWKNR